MIKFFLTLSCIIFLNSYDSVGQSIKRSQVAPDFTGYKGVLLIRKSQYNFPNQLLKTRFEKHYEGGFEIIEFDNLKNAIYADIEKYRFSVKFVLERMSSSGSLFKFIMTDRVTGKDYETKGGPDNTIPPYAIINKYAKALEKIRKQ